MFEARFQVAWGDVDYNRHMGNTAFLDYAPQTRFLQLTAAGFGPDAFAAHGLGPVMMKAPHLRNTAKQGLSRSPPQRGLIRAS